MQAVGIYQYVTVYFLLFNKKEKSIKWGTEGQQKSGFEMCGWVKWAFWQHGFSFGMFNCDV